MIYIKNLSLSFGQQDIFKNINCTINAHSKVGLVGANGSGKSTLLKIIAQQELPDDGFATVTSNKKLGYMPQEIVLNSEETILNHAFISIGEIEDTEKERVKSEIKRVLTGLGFSIDQMQHSVNTLSVGWKMRLFLGELLLKKADFYLFDEPTNHLDIVTKEWLLTFLQRAHFGFMLVSHDRYFINTLSSKIFELENGNLTIYQGNYDKYRKQKAENFERLKTSYEQQKKEMAQKKRTIERFRASASKSKMAKSMERALNKIEIIELPPSLHDVNFSFPPTTKANRIVLTAKNISHSFGDKQIFKNVSMEIERGEKVAIVAANGVGKTTLLNIISGSLPLQHGTKKLGDRVKLGIFEQNQEVILDPEKTIIETVESEAQNITSKEIRSLLGCFLFSGKTVDKKIKVLSGGEKNRVSMSKLLAQDTNVLILDEPTNHLDIQSKEILLKGLKKYSGTILFVSHDQDFINNLATRIIELTPNGASEYHGNYEDYLVQKKNTRINSKENTESNNQENKVSQKEAHEARRIISKLEHKLTRIEQKMIKLSEQLEGLEYGTEKFKKIYDDLIKKEKEQDAVFEELEKL